jgi:ribonuclease HII
MMPVDPKMTVRLSGVRDSKQMTPEARELWAERVQSLACGCAVGYASHQEIDALGIVPATRLAVQRALQALPMQPQHLLVDFLELPNTSIPQTSLIKGDRRSLSIAAASILAKTGRDELMRQLDLEFPGYGFAQHKGYGTMAHRQALAQLGPSPVHRLSFSFSTPISNT